MYFGINIALIVILFSDEFSAKNASVMMIQFCAHVFAVLSLLIFYAKILCMIVLK